MTFDQTFGVPHLRYLTNKMLRRSTKRRFKSTTLTLLLILQPSRYCLRLVRLLVVEVNEAVDLEVRRHMHEHQTSTPSQRFQGAVSLRHHLHRRRAWQRATLYGDAASSGSPAAVTHDVGWCCSGSDERGTAKSFSMLSHSAASTSPARRPHPRRTASVPAIRLLAGALCEWRSVRAQEMWAPTCG